MQVRVITGILSALKTFEYIDCSEYPHIGMMVDGFMTVGMFPEKRFNRNIGL
jgi:hypothetical protein